MICMKQKSDSVPFQRYSIAFLLSFRINPKRLPRGYKVLCGLVPSLHFNLVSSSLAPGYGAAATLAMCPLGYGCATGENSHTHTPHTTPWLLSSKPRSFSEEGWPQRPGADAVYYGRTFSSMPVSPWHVRIQQDRGLLCLSKQPDFGCTSSFTHRTHLKTEPNLLCTVSFGFPGLNQIQHQQNHIVRLKESQYSVKSEKCLLLALKHLDSLFTHGSFLDSPSVFIILMLNLVPGPKAQAHFPEGLSVPCTHHTCPCLRVFTISAPTAWSTRSQFFLRMTKFISFFRS